MSSLSPEDKAIRTLCDRCFHQSVWLPATPDHAKLRVTYSTTTNFDDSSLPAVLFIGPMFGTRWNSLGFDELAWEYGVRLICVDRPAFGGSTPVSIGLRVRVWLETVPTLLEQLDVQYVSIVTHSAGTVYTLNTLIHHRSLLDPEAPYVAFLAPWVPVSQHNTSLTRIASKLPAGILNGWAPLNTFIRTKLLPSTSWSGGVFSASTGFFSSSATTDVLAADTSAAAASNTPDSGSYDSDPETDTPDSGIYDFDPETDALMAKLSVKYQFAEANAGANEEVKLCLRKCEDRDWGEASDYSSCIQKIASHEATLSPQGPTFPKLRIDAYFAEKDIMIGKRGQEYFEKCWESDEVGEKVVFRSFMNSGTDHDSVLVDFERGALRSVFQSIAGDRGQA